MMQKKRTKFKISKALDFLAVCILIFVACTVFFIIRMKKIVYATIIALPISLGFMYAYWLYRKKKNSINNSKIIIKEQKRQVLNRYLCMSSSDAYELLIKSISTKFDISMFKQFDDYALCKTKNDDIFLVSQIRNHETQPVNMTDILQILQKLPNDSNHKIYLFTTNETSSIVAHETNKINENIKFFSSEHWIKYTDWKNEPIANITEQKNKLQLLFQEITKSSKRTDYFKTLLILVILYQVSRTAPFLIAICICLVLMLISNMRKMLEDLDKTL